MVAKDFGLYCRWSTKNPSMKSFLRHSRNRSAQITLFFAFAFFVILSIANADESVTEEPVEGLEDMVKSFYCRSYSKCEGKKGEDILPPEKMSYKTLVKRVCFCDKDCDVFGECCADLVGDPSNNETASTNIDTFEEEIVVQKFQGIPTERWSCHRLNQMKNDTREWAYLVDTCPDDYWDENVNTMCSARHLIPTDEYSYLLDLPVVSSNSGVPYLNMYCLACNEEMNVKSPFYPQTLRFSCSNMDLRVNQIHQDSLYLRGERIWIAEGWNCTLDIVDSMKVFFGSGSELDPDRPGIYARRCLPREDDCREGSEELAKKCSSYALYVELRNYKRRKVYKNPHCALCSGRKKEDLICIPTVGTRRNPFSFPSFSQFFEIRWDGGSGGIEQCKPNQVWDVIRRRCAVVRCESGMVYTSGRCEVSVEPYPWNSSCDGNSSDSDLECLAKGVEELDMELEESKEEFHARIQGYLMAVCMSVSIVCLIFHIATYSSLPKLRNLPGRNLLALSWALLVAQVTCMISGTFNNPSSLYHLWSCRVIAVVIHYFFLAAIFWMNVMSVDVWRTFSSSSSRHQRVGGGDIAKRMHMRYGAYAWGVPLTFVLTAITVELIPSEPRSSLEKIQVRYGLTLEGVCWITNKIGFAIFFSFPITLVLVANAVLFALSVCRIHTNQESRRYMIRKAMEEESLCNERLSKVASRNSSISADPPIRRSLQQPRTTSCISVKDKSRLYLYAKLGIIMGFTWICGFIAGLTTIRELWYPFIMLNGLQGAFIFVMFDVKKKILEMLWERFTGKKPNWTNSSSSRSSGFPFLKSSKRSGRGRRKSSDFQSRSTTTSSSKRKSSTVSTRVSISSAPVQICGDNVGQFQSDSGLSESDDVERIQIHLRTMSNQAANGILLSPRYFPDSQPVFSYCGTGSEVAKETIKVETIPEEVETSLNSIKEEEDSLVKE